MADTVPLAAPRTTLVSSHCSYGSRRVIRTGVPWPDDGGRHVGRHAGRGVARLLDVTRDAAGPRRRPEQQAPLLQHAGLDVVPAERVDQPLHARPQLVVAVAVVVEHPQDGLDRGHEVFLGGEVLERQGGVGVGAEAAGHEHPEAGLDRAVVERAGRGDDADVVEHGLTAVGGAAREVDLELPGQALAERVADEVPVGRLGPRRDVELLVRAGAGEVAGHDVADRVAAGLSAGHADAAQQAHDLGHLLELHVVELHVLAGGDVAPAARVGVGEVGHHLELVGQHAAPRDLDPHHLVVAALALPVDAVVQAEDAEGVLFDVTREVLGEDLLELLGVGELCGVDLALTHCCSDLGGGNPGRIMSNPS